MTVEQFVAILGAITALIVAVGAVFAQVRQTHQLVNSRMTELLAVAKQASHAEGVLDERQTQLTSTGLPGPVQPNGSPVAPE